MSAKPLSAADAQVLASLEAFSANPSNLTARTAHNTMSSTTTARNGVTSHQKTASFGDSDDDGEYVPDEQPPPKKRTRGSTSKTGANPKPKSKNTSTKRNTHNNSNTHQHSYPTATSRPAIDNPTPSRQDMLRHMGLKQTHSSVTGQVFGSSSRPSGHRSGDADSDASVGSLVDFLAGDDEEIEQASDTEEEEYVEKRIKSRKVKKPGYNSSKLSAKQVRRLASSLVEEEVGARVPTRRRVECSESPEPVVRDSMGRAVSNGKNASEAIVVSD